MKQIVLLLGMLIISGVAAGQDTVGTSPPMIPNNGQSGITFEVESTQAVDIIGLLNVFNSASSATLWMRTGGVKHQIGMAPDISSANGWSKVVTNGAVSGANGSSLVPLSFSGQKISLQPNTRYGFFIEGSTRYQTGNSSDSTVFSDGVLSVIVDDDASYGGGPPTPTYHPRRFIGAVIYEGAYTGPCPPPGILKIDSLSCSEAQISWASNMQHPKSFIEYGPSGFVPGTGAGTVVHATSPHTLTGLTVGGFYDVYAADTCDGDTTNWEGPASFITLVGPLEADFSFNIGVPSLKRQPVLFDASASLGAKLYDWHFDDGEEGAGKLIPHMYETNGSYDVTLVISGGCGVDSVTKTVLIEEVNLQDHILNRSLEIYPNPATDDIRVSFTTGKPGNVEITVTDLSGRLMKSVTADNQTGFYENEIDLSELASGTYMLKIRSSHGNTVRKIVKE